MRLLRIGATTLNMERVNHIADTDDQIIVTFDDSVQHPHGSVTITNEDEVVVLRRWLLINTEDAADASEDSTGAPLGPPRTYVSPR